MERVKEGGGGGEERKEGSFLPLPRPHISFLALSLSLPIFRAGKAPKIPFFAPKPHGNACYPGYGSPPFPREGWFYFYCWFSRHASMLNYHASKK